jgi:hypothetical protein
MLLELATALAMLADPGVARLDPPAHVRPVSDQARHVLDDGLRRSATLAGLVAQLQSRDVIVDFEVDLLKEGARGSTTIVSVIPGVRLLRVIVNWRLGPRERIEVLGHELHHALEIAKATDIVDGPTFRRFYRRAGYETGQGGFETEAAQRVEANVRRDLSRPALKNVKNELPDDVSGLEPAMRI